MDKIERKYMIMGGIIGAVICIIGGSIILPLHSHYVSYPLGVEQPHLANTTSILIVFLGYFLIPVLAMFSAGPLFKCNFKSDPCILESSVGFIAAALVLIFIYYTIGSLIGRVVYRIKYKRRKK